MSQNSNGSMPSPPHNALDNPMTTRVINTLLIPDSTEVVVKSPSSVGNGNAKPAQGPPPSPVVLKNWTSSANKAKEQGRETIRTKGGYLAPKGPVAAHVTPSPVTTVVSNAVSTTKNAPSSCKIAAASHSGAGAQQQHSSSPVPKGHEQVQTSVSQECKTLFLDTLGKTAPVGINASGLASPRDVKKQLSPRDIDANRQNGDADIDSALAKVKPGPPAAGGRVGSLNTQTLKSVMSSSSPTRTTIQTAKQTRHQPTKTAETTKESQSFRPTQSTQAIQPTESAHVQPPRSTGPTQQPQATLTTSPPPAQMTSKPDTLHSTQPTSPTQPTDSTPATQLLYAPAKSTQPAQPAKPAKAVPTGPAQIARTAEMSQLTQASQPTQTPKTPHTVHPTPSNRQVQAAQHKDEPVQPTQTARTIQTGPPTNVARTNETTQPVGLSPSLKSSSPPSSPRSAASSPSTDDMSLDDDPSLDTSVSTPSIISEPDAERAERQSQLKKTLQSDVACIKAKGDETEQRIDGLEREIRERLEKLEKGIIKVDRLEMTLKRIQSLEGRLEGRVEALEKGLKKVHDAVFPTPPGHLRGPTEGGETNPVESADPNRPEPTNNPVQDNQPTDDPVIIVCGPKAPYAGPDPEQPGNSEPNHPLTNSGHGIRLSLRDSELEIPDGKIQELFRELENKIQALVLRHFNYNVDETTAANIAKDYWASAFPSEDWENPASSPKLPWFRGLIANLIYAELFAKPFFGCDDEAIEGGLAGFERLMAGDGQSTGKHYLRLTTSHRPLTKCAQSMRRTGKT